MWLSTFTKATPSIMDTIKLTLVIAGIFTSVQGQFQLSLELAQMAREIPGGGIPGIDYPVLAAIPDTGFICRSVGYFPDPQVNCQVFHVCSYSKPTMIKDSYLCPNGTTFNVYKHGCDWWFNSDCVQPVVQQLAREIEPSEVTKSYHTGTIAVLDDSQNSSVFTIIPTSTQSSSLQTTMWNIDNAGTSIFTIMPTKTTNVPSMVISSQNPSNITSDQLRPIEITQTPDSFDNTNIVNNIRDIVAGFIPEVTTSSFFPFSLPGWPVGFNFSFPTVTTESSNTDTEFDVTPMPDILAPEDTTTLGDRNMSTGEMEDEENMIVVKLPGGNKVKVTATSDGPVPNIEIDTELPAQGDISDISKQETNNLSGNRHTSGGNLKPVITMNVSPTEYPFFKSDSENVEDTTIFEPLNKDNNNNDNTNNDINSNNDSNDNKININNNNNIDNNNKGNNNINNNNNYNNNDFELVTEYLDEPTTWHYPFDHGIVNIPSAFPTSSDENNVDSDAKQPEVTLFNDNNVDSDAKQPEVTLFDDNNVNGNNADTNIHSITTIYDENHSTEFHFVLDDSNRDLVSNTTINHGNGIHPPKNESDDSVSSVQVHLENVTTISPLTTNDESKTKPSILSNNPSINKPSPIKPSISQEKPSKSEPIKPIISETETNSVYRKVDEPKYESYPNNTFTETSENNFLLNGNSNVPNIAENPASVSPSTDSNNGNSIEDSYPSVDEDLNSNFKTEAPITVTKSTSIPLPSTRSSAKPVTTPSTRVRVPLTRRTTSRPRLADETRSTTTNQPPTTSNQSPIPSTRVRIPLTRRTTSRPRLTDVTRRTTTNQPPTTPSNLNPLFFNNEADSVIDPLLRTDLEPFVPTAMPVNRCSQVKITRDGALPHDVAALARNIPGGGVPGIDYPILAGVIRSNFHCEDFSTYGYYADPQACCQMYHVCHPQGIGWKRDSFICPNGTIFNQKVNVCDWWYNTECSQVEQFYPAKRRARSFF